MKTDSFERAEELTHEINKMLDLPGAENTFIDKYAQTFLLIILAVFLLIFIFGTVSGFWPGLLTNKTSKIKIETFA